MKTVNFKLVEQEKYEITYNMQISYNKSPNKDDTVSLLKKETAATLGLSDPEKIEFILFK